MTEARVRRPDERADNATLEKMAARLELLADAAREFAAASQDYMTTMQAVARRMSELGGGDLCSIRTISDEDDAFDSSAAAYHPDQEVIRAGQALLSVPQRVGEGVSGRVAETGQPMLIPVLDPVQFGALIPPRFRPFLDVYPITSLIALPLRSRGRVIGVAQLLRSRPGQPFTDDDVRLFEALAEHAALAIANARSYAAERTAQERYRIIFESNPQPIYVFDPDTLEFLEANAAAEAQSGYTRAELRRLTLETIWIPEDLEPNRALLTGPIDPARPVVVRHRRRDGSTRMVELRLNALVFAGRSARLVLVKDVTDQLRAQEALSRSEGALRSSEEQLRHSQKMDAIGRLAGGVAHDFNNLLSVILGYADLLLGDLRPADPMREDVEEIRGAAVRASSLTAQLLMFSRKQIVQPRVIELHDVLASLERMLRRILGEDIELVLVSRAVGRVRVDPSHIEQVILNLSVNARDAMPRGGKLTIETAAVELDESYAFSHIPSKPGPHVMLAVSDTGLGMDRETQAHIFEPFFTTKAQGKGTGLGLSTVFGIVQQAGGNIWVYSEVGKGTTFKVYLPRVDDEADAVKAPGAPLTLDGDETILLVEDEEPVRVVLQTMLKRHGYKVVPAEGPGAAILAAEKHEGPIHLLLTDVVMPQMGGPELAARLMAVRPEMKVLYMSGYTDDNVVRHGVLEQEAAFIQKPVMPVALATRVREVLGRP